MCIISMDIGKVIKPAEFIDFSKGKITHCLGSVKQKCLRYVVFNLCSGPLKFPGMKFRMARPPGPSHFPIYTLGFHERLYKRDIL